MMRTIILAALVATVAVALPAVAAAGGPVRPDDRATRGVGAVALDQATSVVRPDDRATRGVGAVALDQATSGVRPDDRATRGVGALGHAQSATAAHAVPAARDSAGFDRGAAAIGSGVGVALLAAAVLLALRSRSLHPAT